MTDKEVIIDISECRDKCNDDCMAMPIVNEYGDLMYYQSCEAQTECPYRLKQKLQRLQSENDRYKQALEEIKEIAYRLRTKRDYTSPDEVNKDIDSILQKCEGYMNE